MNGTRSTVDIVDVEPLREGPPISFRNIEVFHRACAQRSALQKHRNPVDNSWRLTCACGFRFELLGDGVAVQTFTEVAIGAQTRTLPIDSYRVEQGGVIEVHARTAG